MSISESIKTTPVPTTRQESAFPQLRERLKKLSRLFRAVVIVENRLIVEVIEFLLRKNDFLTLVEQEDRVGTEAERIAIYRLIPASSATIFRGRDRLLGVAKLAVIAAEMFISHHRLQEISAQRQCRTAALPILAVAEVNAAIFATHPSSHHESRRNTHKPGIAIVARRARLAAKIGVAAELSHIAP